MAYWVMPSNNSTNCKSFICDYRTDIEKLPRTGIHGEHQENDTVSSLPCSYGSDCFCLEDASVFILGKDTNMWKEV